MATLTNCWRVLIYGVLNPGYDRLFLQNPDLKTSIISSSHAELKLVCDSLIEGVSKLRFEADKQRFLKEYQEALLVMQNTLQHYRATVNDKEYVLEVYDSLLMHIENALSFIRDNFAYYINKISVLEDDRTIEVPASHKDFKNTATAFNALDIVYVNFKGSEIYLLHKSFLDAGGAPAETYKSLIEKTCPHLGNRFQKGFSSCSIQKASDKVDPQAKENVKRFLQKMIRNIDSYE